MKRGFLGIKTMMYLPLLLSSVFTINSCSANDRSTNNQKEIPSEPEEDGTAKMVKLLNDAHGQIDPMKVEYFLNSIRAANYKSLMTTSSSISGIVISFE